MSRLAVDARGLGGLRASAAAAADELRQGMPKAQQRAAELIVDVARAQTVPVRTGRLRDGLQGVDGAVVDAVPYAGTVHARDPFIVRAVDLAGDRVVAVYDDDLGRILSTI